MEKRKEEALFFFFFLNGRRTHFPKQPAGLFFHDGRQTYVTIFTANGKVDAGKCDLSIYHAIFSCGGKKKFKKKIRIFGKRSYFSCFFNSFFNNKKKKKKKQAASKKEAGGDAKHVFFFTSPNLAFVKGMHL